MELLFEEEDGKIIDICPCSSFKAKAKNTTEHIGNFRFMKKTKLISNQI